MDEKALEQFSLKIADIIDVKLEEKLKAKIEELQKSGAFKVESKDLKNVEIVANKSVMNPDPLTRKAKPFLSLSKEMEQFVKDFKYFAKTGIIPSRLKALSEGDDTAGGFLVPEEFSAEVIRYASEEAVVRGRARIISMTRDSLSMPTLDQSADQFGGVTAYWAGESGEKTESEPKFGKINLVAKKLVGLTVASDELLEDSAVNLANYLINLFGEAIAYYEDYAFLRGDGLTQPLGIITDSRVNLVERAGEGITVDDLYNMEAALPAQFEKNAVWLMNKKTKAAIRKLTTGESGFPLWVPSLEPKSPQLLLGYPAIVTDKLPDSGSDVTGDLVLCDLSYYFIGDRQGLQIASSIHDRFRYDETTFRFVKRVDGQPAVPKAFVVLCPAS